MSTSLEYNSTIVERVDLTDALSIFRIQPDKPPRKRSWFRPGQYCVLGINNLEGRPVRRPMSIASAPEADGPVEFYIRRIANPQSRNPLTHILWTLGNGDRLYMRTVAAGVFTIADTTGIDDPRIRVMVASGTGIAPFMSMLRSEICRDRRADLSNWVLLHGASLPADLGYRSELLELTATNSLRYWGTVSRPQEALQWTGDTGRVESFFARMQDLERRLDLPAGGFNPAEVAVFVCGLTGTLSACVVPLVDRGFIPNHDQLRDALGVPREARASIFFEYYDTKPLVDITQVESLRTRLQAALAARRTHT